MKSLLLVPALISLALLASVKDCRDRVCPRGMTLEVTPATGETRCVCRAGLVPAPDGVGCVMPPPPPEPSPTPEPSPSVEPSPSPSPIAEPTPTPQPSTTASPSPTPDPSPTPASCPALACIHAQVHLAAGPGGLLPAPTACDGCRVVLDSTPLFEVCLARGRCNSEHDTYCHGRACEDPRGYVWRKAFAPADVRWNVQQPGPERGYQVVIQTPVAGAYAWEVCAANPLDGEGQPVRLAGPECNRVRFDVR